MVVHENREHEISGQPTGQQDSPYAGNHIAVGISEKILNMFNLAH